VQETQQTKEAKMEDKYIVDFGSVYIDQETYDKLDDAEFCRQWIQENAYIDQVIKNFIKEDEK
jgi:hypothetical protein